MTPTPTAATDSPVFEGPLSRRRRFIATRLGAVAHESVMVTLTADAEIRGPGRAVDVLYFALVQVLHSDPALNGTFEADTLRTFSTVNLGVAFEGPQGLVVPVIHGAELLEQGELTQARRDLAGAVRDESLTAADLEGGTFTVSNLGPFGIKYFTPIINPPQLGILGVGAARAAEGVTTVPLSLTFDHRVNDGVAAARVLKGIQEKLRDVHDHR